MGRIEILAFVGLYVGLYVFSAYAAYSFGHYRGTMADLEAATASARQEAFMEGVQAGEDWENNKHSLSCNGA